MVATAIHTGWTVQSAMRFVDDLGISHDLAADPPRVVIEAVRDAVRRWRIAHVAASFPGLIPARPDYGNGHGCDGRHIVRYPDGMPLLPRDAVDLTGQIRKLLHGKRFIFFISP